MVYEQKQNKRLLLIARVRLASEAQQKTFFATYSDALEKKYPKRTDESREPGFFHFTTADGGVFFRCVDQECAELEGGDTALFSTLTKELNWTSVVQTANGGDKAKTPVLSK